ncbi:4Fe-4S dicluster domain-containing protein [Acetobacterium woodii]|uniref:Nitrite and sulphite reductase 4Fe-4S region n=1 Tax=Acetobacterium woodii (strain ATCC 29683 / DSM 1030 / JCM 2381 / KCTC 1655 / WB1) TaxID=931626 RepID=H6LGL7_ACEWD|nr:nitrite and sulphite reductase 4Fe-4S region [Acetobacterium woodii DSM 1030]
MTLAISKEEEKKVKGLGFLRNRGTDNFSGRVITENGLITTEQAKCIIEAAEKYGNGKLALTTRLTIECQGIPFEKINEFKACLAQGGLETGGTGAKVRPVLSCKGTTCQYGLIDTFALAKEIHDRFYSGMREITLPHKFKIAVGGCPNNCVKPDLNDLGIIGQYQPELQQESCRNCKNCNVIKACPIGAIKMKDGLIKIDENACLNCGRCIDQCPFDVIKNGIKGYKLVVGGRWGKQGNKGKALDSLFRNKEDVLDMVEKIIYFYKEQGQPGERFATTIERLGFEIVQEKLLC